MKLVPGSTYSIDYVYDGVKYNRVGIFKFILFNANAARYCFCFDCPNQMDLILHVSDDVRIRPLNN